MENFFSIVPETCTRWRQSLNSCASRLDNSKFYRSLHLPLPDLPSRSLLLGLHRASKDLFFFVSTTFLQSKQDDSDGSSVAIEKDAIANISIAIWFAKKRGIFDGITNNQRRANHKLLHTKGNKFCLSVKC